MNLQEIRAQYPQYSGLSDEQLADGLYRKFYDGKIPREQFNERIGLKSAAGAQQPQAQSSTIENFAAGAVRGVRDLIDRPAQWAAQAAPRAWGAMMPGNAIVQAQLQAAGQPRIGEGEGERVAALNQQGRQDFERQYGDSTAATIGRIGGQVAGSIPVAGGIGAAVGAVPRLGGLGQAISTFGARGPNLATRAAGGAVAGGATSGLIDPQSAPIGAAIGGAFPLVTATLGAAGKALGSAVKPFTAKGRQQIADQVIRQAAANPTQVSANLAAPPRSVAPLTLAEVANDPGISALQRQMQNSSQGFADALARTQAEQNAARFGHLYGMSGGEAGIEALKQTRGTATQPLLDAALANAGDVGTMGVRQVAKGVGQSPAFQRRAVRAAVNEAVAPFATTTEEGAKGWLRSVPFEKAWGARQNIDDIVRGASNKVNDQAARAASGQLTQLRESLTRALNRASPDFAEYSKQYAEHSKGISAAETLYDLVKAASTGSRDMFDNPVLSGAMLDRALKRIDARQWANLTATQRAQVGELARELTRSAGAQNLGRAVGSNTAQNLMQPESMPLMLRALSGIAPGGGLLTDAVRLATSGPRAQVQQMVGSALLDPAIAARAFQPPPAPMLGPSLAPMLGQTMNPLLSVTPAGLLAGQR